MTDYSDKMMRAGEAEQAAGVVQCLDSDGAIQVIVLRPPVTFEYAEAYALRKWGSGVLVDDGDNEFTYVRDKR